LLFDDIFKITKVSQQQVQLYLSTAYARGYDPTKDPQLKDEKVQRL
jgi:hypothetical protein